MYQIENSKGVLKNKDSIVASLKKSFGSTVFFLGLTSFFTDISSEMISTTLPLYLIYVLHFSPFQVGIIDGLYQGASVLVRLISGLITDRLQKPKEVAAFGYFLSAINKIGFLVGGTSWVALSSLVLIDRIGKGIRTPPRDALIAESTTTENAATSFGIHRALDTFGALLGPLIAAGILLALPRAYPVVFAVSTGFAMVGLLIILLFVPGSSKNSLPYLKLPLSEIKKLFLLPDFTKYLIGSALLALFTISDSFIYLSLQQKFKVPSSMFPLFYIGVAFVFMLFAVPVGKLADKYGRLKVFVIGNMLLMFSYLAFFVPTDVFVILPLILFFIGLYYAATDGVLMTIISGIVPSQTKATGLAFVSTGIGLSKLISSIVFGYLWGKFGIYNTLIIYTSLFFIVFIMFVLVLKKNDNAI